MADQHLDPEVARRYDDAVAGRFEPDVLGPTVDRLAEIAAGGRALEFAIGTGRVALALAAAGVEVHGIDASEPMIAELRAKEGGAGIPVTVGDMASARVPGDFAVVFLVFNTITNLTTQAEQVACFRNAAAHLVPGGRFVIEVEVPDPPRRGAHARHHLFDVSDDHVGVDEYVDRAGQILVSHHTYPQRDTMRTLAGRFRYVWPSELDLMAQLAGMELEHRWEDWHRTPFGDTSPSHVSVWRRPP